MAQPFIKCLGGKKGLTDRILALFPSEFSVYVEPFLGGASVFFAAAESGVLRDKIVLLSDSNSALIDLYDAVKVRPHQLHEVTKELVEDLHQQRSEHGRVAVVERYRQIRAHWNEGVKKPWYTFFLHRAAYNGLWRVNQKGQMNSDVGFKADKETPTAMTPDLWKLLECSHALEGTTLLDWDFRKFETEKLIGPNTVVYVDPPYADGFVGYTAEGFSEQDQIDVIKHASLWSEKGAHVIYSNRDTPTVRGWVEEHWKSAETHQAEMYHSVSRVGAKRKHVGELLVSTRSF